MYSIPREIKPPTNGPSNECVDYSGGPIRIERESSKSLADGEAHYGVLLKIRGPSTPEPVTHGSSNEYINEDRQANYYGRQPADFVQKSQAVVDTEKSYHSHDYYRYYPGQNANGHWDEPVVREKLDAPGKENLKHSSQRTWKPQQDEHFLVPRS
jgi:hypothetical protein